MCDKRLVMNTLLTTGLAEIIFEADAVSLSINWRLILVILVGLVATAITAVLVVILFTRQRRSEER
jgi:hypothetical protein